MSFIVDVKTITPGMSVIVEPLSRRNGVKYVYLVGAVETVGRKYFYVRCENYSYLLKFALANGKCESDYGDTYQAYPDMETFQREKFRKEMFSRIRDLLNTPRTAQALSYGTVKTIYDVLGLPDLTEHIFQKKIG